MKREDKEAEILEKIKEISQFKEIIVDILFSLLCK